MQMTAVDWRERRVQHGGGGALKGQRRVGGPSLIKVRNLYLPYFGIMFEAGS